MIGFAIFMFIVLMVFFVFALCSVSSRADQESEMMSKRFTDGRKHDGR